jgi:hypothetical protein
MFGVALMLFLATAPATVNSPSSQPSNTNPQDAGSQAKALALVGHNKLQLGRPDEARIDCDAALKLDSTNAIAKDCLDQAATMFIDQDLNQADARLLSGDKKGAIDLASKWARAGARRPDQQTRAWRILHKARSTSLQDVFVAVTPAWLRDILVTVGIFAGLALLLLGFRGLWRKWKRGAWHSATTTWNMLPLRELSAAADLQTGMPTEAILDALGRLGHELATELWQPKLLLLRPTPPAEHEPATICEFLPDSLQPLVLVPAAKDLSLEWKLHDIQLDQAVQNLQLKTAAGIDIGSVARFMRGIWEWLNAGAPSITGVSRTTDKAVSLHLAAHGGRVQAIAVGASTDSAPGIDALQLSAERVALKFLFRMRYPNMTNGEIDGFAALRQGACQFARYAGAVPGAGEDFTTRTASLAEAAFNLGFFRASVPVQCSLRGASKECTSLALTDEIRQAVLLAEGVAHALVGGEKHLISAIDCFRQLQDWPGSRIEVLRQQAAYNEAMVWRARGAAGHCVLMLTGLLGERAPDTVPSAVEAERVSSPPVQELLPPAIRLAVRLARLSAFSTYDRDGWTTLPQSRADLLIDDAERLIPELDSIRRQTITPADQRVASYMYIEALRAAGHIELLFVISTAAARLYQDKRPTGLKDSDLDAGGVNRLCRAITFMRTCEDLAPGAALFCDLAEAYLLLKDFTRAQGYARHATLESKPDDSCYERAYYIATESFFLQNASTSRGLAKKYAMEFKGTVKLDEFKSVRAELGVGE